MLNMLRVSREYGVYGDIAGKHLTCLTFPGLGAFVDLLQQKCSTFPGLRAHREIRL